VGLVVADNKDLTKWSFLPPVLSANCVNDQTERPQIFIQNEGGKMPTSPWRGTMAIPRELTLSGGGGGGSSDGGGKSALRSSIASVPAGVWSGGVVAERRLTVADGSMPLGEDFSSRSQLLDVALTPDGAEEPGIELRGLKISYQAQSSTLTLDRSAAGTSNFSDKFGHYHQVRVPLMDGKLKLRILLDSSSVEVFAPESGTVITDLFLPDWSDTDASVFSEGGKAGLTLTGRKLA
jgi:fructan beta-fructosidase